jgi:hypothetical protein
MLYVVHGSLAVNNSFIIFYNFRDMSIKIMRMVVKMNFFPLNRSEVHNWFDWLTWHIYLQKMFLLRGELSFRYLFVIHSLPNIRFNVLAVQSGCKEITKYSLPTDLVDHDSIFSTAISAHSAFNIGWFFLPCHKKNDLFATLENYSTNYLKHYLIVNK